MISSIFTNSKLHIDLFVHYGQVGCGVSKPWVHHMLDIIEKLTKIGHNYRNVPLVNDFQKQKMLIYCKN